MKDTAPLIGFQHDWVILKRAIAQWGEVSQEMMAVGEIGEFLTLIGRKAQNRMTREDMQSEIADVIIMMHQMALIYGLDGVSAQIDYKLSRLSTKLEKHENGKDSND